MIANENDKKPLHRPDTEVQQGADPTLLEALSIQAITEIELSRLSRKAEVDADVIFLAERRKALGKL